MSNQSKQEMWRSLSQNEQQEYIEYFLQEFFDSQPQQAQQVVTQLCQHNPTLSRQLIQQLQSADSSSSSSNQGSQSSSSQQGSSQQGSSQSQSPQSQNRS